jgi:hypothetical protein
MLTSMESSMAERSLAARDYGRHARTLGSQDLVGSGKEDGVVEVDGGARAKLDDGAGTTDSIPFLPPFSRQPDWGQPSYPRRQGQRSVCRDHSPWVVKTWLAAEKKTALSRLMVAPGQSSTTVPGTRFHFCHRFPGNPTGDSRATLVVKGKDQSVAIYWQRKRRRRCRG